MPSYCVDFSSLNTLVRHRGIGTYAAGLAKGIESIRHELRGDERLLGAFFVDEAPREAPFVLENYQRPLPPVSEQPAQFEAHFVDRWTKLYARLKRAEPSLVHFIEGPQAMPASNYASIITCHDLIPLRMPQWYIGSRTYKEPLRRAKDFFRHQVADRIIAISQATALDLEQILRIPSQRIVVIPQGLDHDAFQPVAAPGERDELARRFSLPPRYTLYAGACDYRKQIPLLLDAQRTIFRATGVPLALVGSWTALPPKKLRPLLDAMPAGSVRCLGEVLPSDLPALYRHADLHLLPSIYEGFGLTVLEAMASGCPVLTTPGGALREVGGDAACYVPPRSASEFEEAAVALLREPARRERLRELGLERARLFTWEKTARATLDVYRHCVGISSPPAR